MRRILFAALIGAVTAAPALAQPLPYQRESDREYDREHARNLSRRSADLVSGWFAHFFNQQPDPHSLIVWGNQVDQSGNPDQVLAHMVGQSVYYDQAGDSPEGFVRKLFRDLTGRDPSRPEFGFWMGRLYSAGGASPDVDDRTNVAYDMIRRYPPPSVAQDRDRDRDRDLDRDHDRDRNRDRDDDYDYRRPEPWRDRR